MRTLALFLLLSAASLGVSPWIAAAQGQQPCPAIIRVPAREGPVGFPPQHRGFTTVEVVESDGSTVVEIGVPIPIQEDSLRFSREAVDALRAHASSASGPRKLLLTGTRRCAVAFRFSGPMPRTGGVIVKPAEEGEGDPPINTGTDRLERADATLAWDALPATDRLYEAGQCAIAGRAWVEDLYRARYPRRGRPSDEAIRRADFTAVVVLPETGTCYTSRSYGVAGDPIHVAVFTDDRFAWQRARVAYTRCAAESATPVILGSTALGQVAQELQSETYSLIEYQARDCHNTDVEISLTSRPPSGAGAVTEKIQVEQARRYRAGVQLGSVFSNAHERSYGVQTVRDTIPRIYDKGPVHEGPEYFASAVLYGLPHYIPELFRGRLYGGRDVIHDRSFFDRIGGVFGVGLPEPRDRFVLGAAFEIIPGFNVTYVHQWHRGTRLAAGLAVDSVFRGAENTIPKQSVWRTNWNWGLSVDATYVAQLLVGK